MTRRGIEAFAYPASGEPKSWRSLQSDMVVPDGAAKLVVVAGVSKQWSPDDVVEFSEIRLQRLVDESQ